MSCDRRCFADPDAETEYECIHCPGKDVDMSRVHKITKEVIEGEKSRSILNRFVEVIRCRFLGHERHFNIFAGRYNPRYCYHCHKHVALW